MEREYSVYPCNDVLYWFGFFFRNRWCYRYHPCRFYPGYYCSRYIFCGSPFPHCNGSVCYLRYVCRRISLVPETIPENDEQKTGLLTFLDHLYWCLWSILPYALFRNERGASSLLYQ